MNASRRYLPWLLVVVVLVAALGLGWVGWQSHHDAASAPDADLPADGVVAATADASRPRPTASSGIPELPAAEAVAQTRAQIAARRKQSAEALERERRDAASAFASEPVNPVWAAATERQLDRVAAQPAIQQNGATPKDMQIQCRSSMCRIQSDFGQGSQADDWTLMFMASVGSTMPHALVSQVTNPDGTRSVVIYSRTR